MVDKGRKDADASCLLVQCASYNVASRQAGRRGILIALVLASLDCFPVRLLASSDLPHLLLVSVDVSACTVPINLETPPYLHTSLLRTHSHPETFDSCIPTLAPHCIALPITPPPTISHLDRQAGFVCLCLHTTVAVAAVPERYTRIVDGLPLGIADLLAARL